MAVMRSTGEVPRGDPPPPQISDLSVYITDKWEELELELELEELMYGEQ